MNQLLVILIQSFHQLLLMMILIMMMINTMTKKPYNDRVLEATYNTEGFC